MQQVFLSKLETGERRPSPQTLVKIAGALGLSVGEPAGKIAVVEANTAPTDAELQRRPLRAAVESPSHLRDHSVEVTLTLLAALVHCRRSPMRWSRCCCAQCMRSRPAPIGG